MSDRARRIQRLRRRVAVAAVVTFTAAFGGVAATGSMGRTDTATTAVTTQDTSSAGITTTAAAPSAMTTRQS